MNAVGERTTKRRKAFQLQADTVTDGSPSDMEYFVHVLVLISEYLVFGTPDQTTVRLSFGPREPASGHVRHAARHKS